MVIFLVLFRIQVSMFLVFWFSIYMLYGGEPLAPQGDDVMDKISEETTEEADLDGSTSAILEAR
jgi:predicted PurR-regulated permease PerM